MQSFLKALLSRYTESMCGLDWDQHFICNGGGGGATTMSIELQNFSSCVTLLAVGAPPCVDRMQIVQHANSRPNGIAIVSGCH